MGGTEAENLFPFVIPRIRTVIFDIKASLRYLQLACQCVSSRTIFCFSCKTEQVCEYFRKIYLEFGDVWCVTLTLC